MSRKPSRKKKKQTRRYSGLDLKKFFSNIVIIGLFMIIAGFVWSFMSNTANEGKYSFEGTVNLPEKLISSTYEKRTGHRINVEVLNGCSVPKLAALYQEYLRAEGIDVYRADNADHSEYSNTILIRHQCDSEIANELAQLMGISPENIKLDDANDPVLDATIILGRDYDSLNSFRKALLYKTP